MEHGFGDNGGAHISSSPFTSQTKQTGKFCAKGKKGEIRKRTKQMDRRNLHGLIIGIVGAALTLFAYSQTVFTPTQCIAMGLFVLMFGLLVTEGLVSL
ncbi:uncharacterized protein [Aristolochia californica]|uniref:uncharacterized protein n=1 Tax=Aristolochia californica TaxID=171875 RepID=UPI0035D9F04B